MRRFGGEVRFGGDCVARVTDEKARSPFGFAQGRREWLCHKPFQKSIEVTP